MNPDNKLQGANMEPIWGRHEPGGPHVGPMNFAIWESSVIKIRSITNIAASSEKYTYRSLAELKLNNK